MENEETGGRDRARVPPLSPWLTLVGTIGTAIITYAVTITLAYARLDKDVALNRQAIGDLERRILSIEQTRSERTQEIGNMENKLQELDSNVQYWNRQLRDVGGDYYNQPARRK